MRYLNVPSDLNTAIQDHDFALSGFDNEASYSGKLKILYILISTPRSGSTALCVEIYRQTGLVIHEYLQPFQYMPCLASRYDATEKPYHAKDSSLEQVIILTKYVKELVKHRAIDGTLGINCHASHLTYLNAFIKNAKDSYPSLKIYKDYLYRQDKYKQAASYAIAKQTRLWSATHQTRRISMGYLEKLRLCISAAGCHRKLMADDKLISASHSAIDYERLLSYETHVQANLKETAEKIASALCLRSRSMDQSRTLNLHRQASALNDEIAKSIKHNMAILKVLNNISKLLYKIRSFLILLFKQLTDQQAAVKTRYLLKIDE